MLNRFSVVMAFDAWYSSTVKYTEVGDAEGDICTRDVVAALGNKDVLAFELFVVTLPNELTQDV